MVKMLEILAGISRIFCELNGQKKSAVLLPARGTLQQTDLIGVHPKLGFLEELEGLLAWNP